MLKHAVQYSTKRPFSVRFLMYFQACLSIHTYLKKSRKNPQKYLKEKGQLKAISCSAIMDFFSTMS